jgi:Predicted transcriptional regulators
MVAGGLQIEGRTIKNSAVDRKLLGQRVRILRLQKNLQQQELARAAGVTSNTVRGLERGLQETRWPKFAAIAKALGTTPELLLQGEEPITDTHPLLRDLNEEDLRIARAFHHAQTAIRVHVQRVLSGELAAARLHILERLDRLPEEKRLAVEGILEITEPRPEPSSPSKRKASK